jgi:hypothetical protein
MPISQIVQNSIANTVSLAVKIASINVANSTYATIDDTAVDTTGGYIIINGSGFVSGAAVIVGSNTACSVTFVSTTQLRAQIPAQAAGTYNVYVANSDGGVGLKVNGVTHSASPSWVTDSSLTLVDANTAFVRTFSATNATANGYALAAGSSVPSGTTFLANGYYSGTITGTGSNTTYNFSVTATDAELQDSTRAFSLLVRAKPYVSSNLWFDFDAADYVGVLNDGATIAGSSSITNRAGDHGTATTSSGGTTTFRTGNGGYFEYGGSNYFRVTDHTNHEALNRAKSISIIMWLQSNSGGRQVALSRFGSGFNQLNHIVDPNGDYHYNSTGAIGGATGNLDTNSWSTNTWFLSAWVYNVSDGYARWYQGNGTEVASVNFGTDGGNGLAKDSGFTDNHIVGIGTRSDILENLTGRIAIARIYTKALSVAEIQQEWNYFKTRFGL